MEKKIIFRYATEEKAKKKGERERRKERVRKEGTQNACISTYILFLFFFHNISSTRERGRDAQNA
jgi:hypothetical protein